MDLTELKGRIPATSLGDEALQSLLDAALEAIVARFGSINDEAVEQRRPTGPLIRLSQRAQQIISVSEQTSVGWTFGGWGGTTVDLDVLDYQLRPGGSILERLATGPNPARRWRGRVEVHYWPVDDGAERDRVAVDLVKLDLAYAPGLVEQTIGTWTERYARQDTPYQAEREAILASLRLPFVGIR